MHSGIASTSDPYSASLAESARSAATRPPMSSTTTVTTGAALRRGIIDSVTWNQALLPSLRRKRSSRAWTLAVPAMNARCASSIAGRSSGCARSIARLPRSSSNE